MQNSMLESVQNENKQLAQTCAMMENDIVQYRDKLDKIKSKRKTKLLLEKKLEKRLKNKEKEIHTLKNQVSSEQQDKKGCQDELNIKLIEQKQISQDLLNQLDGKAKQMKNTQQ